MQMNDPVIMQILNTQTQMLQQMQNLQNQQTVQGLPAGIPMSGQPMSVGMGATMFDPSAYASYATPYVPNVGMGHSLQRQSVPMNTGFVAQMANDFLNYTPTMQSRESQSDFLAQQTRLVQEGVLNTAQSIGQVGSFFLPGGLSLAHVAAMGKAGSLAAFGRAAGLAAGGLAVGTLTGIAVGGTIKTMADEARTAMNYEDTLRQKSYTFLNPFESTSELGGIGFSRAENQDVAKYLRHLGPEKFLDDQDIQQILNGSMDQKLLRSVTDVDSFKKKFSEIVDTVKHITVTMDQSIDEAMKFMGELSARGIGTNQMGFVAAQTKVASSMLGLNASQGAQLVLQTADSVTQGTSITPGIAAGTAANNMAISQMVYDNSATSNPSLHNFMTNSGGPAAMGATMEQNLRQFIGSLGTDKLVGFFGGGFRLNANGQFEVDPTKMQSLLSGNMSLSQLQQQSGNFVGSLTTAQTYELMRRAPTLLQNFAQGSNEYRLLGATIKLMQQQTPGLSPSEALSQVIPGLDPSMADALVAQINMGTDPKVIESLQGEASRQELDAISISETPSPGQRIRAGWAGTFTKPIGDIGQNGMDSLSNKITDISKFISGIKDQPKVGGRTYDFSSSTLEKELGLPSGVLSTSDAPISQGRFNALMDQARTGSLDATTISELSRQMSESKDVLERARLRQVIQTASGNFASIHGTLVQWAGSKIFHDPNFSMSERLGTFALDAAGIGRNIWDYTKNKFIDFGIAHISGNPVSTGIAPYLSYTPYADKNETMAGFQSQKDNLTKEITSADHELNHLFAMGSQATGTDNFSGLEAAIRAGNVDQVVSMTKSGTQAAKAKELAERYSGLASKQRDITKSANNFDVMVKDSAALAASVQKTQQFLVQTGVVSSAGAASWFGSDVSKAVTSLQSGMASGKISASDMLSADRTIYSGLLGTFTTVSDADRSKILDALLAEHPSLGGRDKFLDKNGQVDPYLLAKANMDVRAGEQSDGVTSAVKNGANGMFAKDTDKVMADHAQAMHDVLTTMQGEVGMLNDFKNGRPIQSPKISVNTNPSRRY